MLHGLTRRLKGWLQKPAPAIPAAASDAPEVPEGARRLHEAGVAALCDGKPAEALTFFGEAVTLHPDFAQAHDQAGLALSTMGRHEEALARFQRALAVRHDYASAIYHQGIAFFELQRYEEAEDSFKLALAYGPASAQACLSLAMACWNQQRPDAAIAHFSRALELEPGLVDARLMLAGLLHAEGRLEEAAASYWQVLEAKPGVPEVYLNFGLTLLKLDRLDEAIARFEQALALNPDFPEGHFNVGNARRDQGRPLEAIKCYERALGLKPDYADACMNLALVLKGRGEADRALECFRRAAALDARSAEPHHNMGVILCEIGNVREGIACYEEAQRIQPGHPASQLNLALARLQTGDFQGGWQGYECRFLHPDPELRALHRAFPWPRWNGEPLAGKRILVWGEQGIGDEITFSATYQEAIDAAQACLIECAPKLVPLFSRSFPDARVVAKSDPSHPETAVRYDYQCPAGSLARWLRPDSGSFPVRRGYLATAPERVSYWKSRLGRLGGGLKVGISWRSGNLTGDRPLYCTRLDQWGGILGTPGVQFVCLQYDECREELAAARNRFGVEVLAFAEVDLYNDLEEAAALTTALDLVISAPTSVSLLSAALGVETWQMSYGANWQAHGTDRNLWYPAMTQFTRAWNQDWEEILALIAARLEQQVTQRAGPPTRRDTVAPCAPEPLAQRLNLDTAPADAHAGAGKTEGSDAMARRHYADGLKLERAGRHEDAIECLQRAIECKHDYVDALVSLAGIHVELRQYTDAADSLHLALAFDPRSTAAHVGLGDLCWHMGSGDEAVKHLFHAVEIDPRHPAPLAALGAISRAAGRHEESLKYYEAASALEPGYAELHYNVGLVLQSLQRTPEAITRFRRATELNPDLCEAHLNAGIALLKDGETARAIASFQRVIALQPAHAQAHNNLAAAYGVSGDLEKALASVHRSLAFDPGNSEATCNLGMILHHQGRLEEAIVCYEQAASKVQDAAAAELNLGIARFMTGDFARGWAGYEWRFRANNSENRLLEHGLSCRQWQGEDLAGKSLLVWGEQGVGDQLLLASLLPEISYEAKSCVAECAPKLRSLFARSFPAVTLVPMTNPPDPGTRSGFDYQVLLGGIARWRRPDLGSFPRRRAYLVPEPERVSHWQGRLAALGAGPKIGFSWRSSNTKGDRALKCTELAQWGPIFAVRGAHFLSLQYDECSAEIADAQRRFGLSLHVFPDVDLFNDLDEAAALTRACDLVITAPTAVSMLAAGVGVETWQMNCGPDWQTHGTRGHPWLPAMVRFDRRWNQSWDEYIPDIAEALSEWLKRWTPDK